MKLIRFDGGRTGLLVELQSGPHLIDVVASLGVLGPTDPILQGLLNGILKDHGSWAPLIKHWALARYGLRRLAASATRGHPAIVARPFDEADVAGASHSDGIRSLDIEECGEAALDVSPQEAVPGQPVDVATDTTPPDESIIRLSDYRRS